MPPPGDGSACGKTSVWRTKKKKTISDCRTSHMKQQQAVSHNNKKSLSKAYRTIGRHVFVCIANRANPQPPFTKMRKKY